jgi:hypothetical protein
VKHVKGYDVGFVIVRDKVINLLHTYLISFINNIKNNSSKYLDPLKYGREK